MVFDQTTVLGSSPVKRGDLVPVIWKLKGKRLSHHLGVRGNIARTYFYMNWAYPGHGVISKKNRKLFQAWDKIDPVDDWECERVGG